MNSFKVMEFVKELFSPNWPKSEKNILLVLFPIFLNRSKVIDS